MSNFDSGLPNNEYVHQGGVKATKFTLKSGMSVQSSGSGDVVFKFGSRDCVKISQSGGINVGNYSPVGFAAASGFFDYYDRGQSSPVIVGSTTAGSYTDTGSDVRWQRLGNKLEFWLTAGWSGHTGTGNINIQLGAFFNLTGSISSVNFPLTIYTENITFSGQLTARFNNTTGVIEIGTIRSANTLALLTMQSSGYVNIQGSIYYNS